MNNVRSLRSPMFAIVVIIALQLAFSSVRGQPPGHIAETPSPQPPGCMAPGSVVFSDLSMVKAGENVEFSIRSAYGEEIRGVFMWSTSIGSIISGQGAERIVIQIPANAMEFAEAAPPPPPMTPYIGRMYRGPKVPLTVIARSNAIAGCKATELINRISIGNKSEPNYANVPANIVGLSLEKTELNGACSGKIQVGKSLIGVSARAADFENDVLVYRYIVSAGTIIGSGEKVIWDLSGVAPGKYELTAGADDGCGACGKTLKRTVTINKCNRKGFKDEND